MTMKHRWNAVAAAVLLLHGLCSAAEEGLSAKRENVRLASKLLAEELRKKVEGWAIPHGSLYEAMNSGKAEHADQEKSKELCHGVAKKILREAYRKEAQRIIETLDKDRSEDVESWFSGSDKEGILRFPEDALKKNLSANFDAAFKTAREKACMEQWNKLTADVYPTEQEFEANETAKLRAMLMERILKKQAEPVFAENRALLSERFIDPLLTDAAKQMAEQKKILGQADGGKAVVPSDIADSIKAELRAYQDSLKKEKEKEKVAVKVYSNFPSVANEIPKTADRIAAKKFSAAVSGMPTGAWKDRIKAMMLGNLPDHTGKERSWGICTKNLGYEIRSKAVEDHAKKAPAAAEFRKFLEGLAAYDAECKKAVEGFVEQSLKSGFEGAREEISSGQMAEFFGPLKDSSWKPSDAEIDSHYNELSVNIPKPFELPGISSKRFNQEMLLEETRERVVSALRKLISKGLDMLKRQMAIVEREEPEVKKELEAGKELPAENELIKRFTEKVLSQWSKLDEKSENYPNLFPRVTEDIARRAKAMLPRETVRRKEKEERERKEEKEERERKEEKEERERKEKEKQKEEKGPAKGEKPGVRDDGRQPGVAAGPEKSTGGGKPGAGTGPGGPGIGPEQGSGGEEFVPDGIVDVNSEGDKIFVKMMFPKKKLRPLLLVMDVDGDNSAALKKVQKSFEEMLRKAAAGGASEKEVDVYVVARIFNREVAYGAVFDLRKCLEVAVRTCKLKNLKVRWYDAMFPKSEKGREKVPEDMKERFMPIPVPFQVA